MTDDRAEQLARAIHTGESEPSSGEIFAAGCYLAAIDADPETYGYLVLIHRLRANGYCITCRTYDWSHDPRIEIVKVGDS